MSTQPLAEDTQQLGVINQCQDAGCGRTCCEFTEGNYIALYPGEVEATMAAGGSLAHLEITPLSQGGHRAVCRAADKSTCDQGYKPLDCASYPFFPTIGSEGEIQTDLKGQKCPLNAAILTEHRSWVTDAWSRLQAFIPNLNEWITSVRLVGYLRLSRVHSLDPERGPESSDC